MKHQPLFGALEIGGLEIAYRKAGDPSNPKVVLLHGFPASSHQYRNLVVALSDRFHVIAPDYQGFGNSDAPDPATYAYTFIEFHRPSRNSSPPRDLTITDCSFRTTAAPSDSASSSAIPRLSIG